MSEINIYCVSNNRNDLVMFLDSLFTFNDIGVSSVSDMVGKVVGKCSRGDRIAELRIVGHGNALGQYIGADWVEETTLPPLESELRRLRPLFGGNGLVTLGGCRVGHSSGLMLRMSNILNVPVRGFRAAQRPLIPGDEGSEQRCYITCTRQSRRGFDHVDW
jgi:hypothetical protein